MKYLVTDNRDIRYNLALETYLMEHANLDEPILYFYINSPCIILGRYQDAYEEINQEYVKQHNIIVTRPLAVGPFTTTSATSASVSSLRTTGTRSATSGSSPIP